MQGETGMAALAQVVLELLTLIAVGTTWMVAARAYPTLPERIPVHFGFDGRPDGWGGREMIWLLPAVSTAVTLMNAVIIMLPGHGGPPQPFGLLMALLSLEMAGMMWYIEWQMVEIAMERAQHLGSAIWAFLALILLTSVLLSVVAPRGAR